MGPCFVCGVHGCHGREVGTTWRDAKRKRMWGCDTHLAELDARFDAAKQALGIVRSPEPIAPTKKRNRDDQPGLFDDP